MATADSTVTYRDIPGFPGYRVGDDGSVWLRRQVDGQWHPIRPRATARWGHLFVSMLDAARRPHSCFVHRLVLTAFVGPCPPGMEACHDPDPNPADNRLVNLRWDTHRANVADQIRHGTRARGERRPCAKLTAEQAVAIRIEYAAGRTSQRKLAAKYGVGQTTIQDLLERRTWTHVA